jgi:hypothetical protein
MDRTRHLLVTPALEAGIVGDVLCVQVTGRFTLPRLRANLERLRKATQRTDYGALVLNAMGARMDVSVAELATIWGNEGCPLAARPCAVVYDANRPQAREFCEALGMLLASGSPARVLGAFGGSLLADATTWAAERARGYRLEAARRGTRASSRASSDRPARKRGPGPDPA